MPALCAVSVNGQIIISATAMTGAEGKESDLLGSCMDGLLSDPIRQAFKASFQY